MKLQGGLFLFFLFWGQVLFAQNEATNFVRIALNKTQETRVFQYKFDVYFKSIGETSIPKPWQGEAFVAPDSFVCNYQRWGGRVSNDYAINTNGKARRYFFDDSLKTYQITSEDNERVAPHSGYNCYSPLAKLDKPIFYITDTGGYFLSDTIIHGMKCKRVVYKSLDDGPTSWTETRFYINNKDSFLVGFESFVGFYGIDTIYNSIFLKDYVLNKRFDRNGLLKKIETYKDITNDTILNPPFISALEKNDTILEFNVKGLFDDNKKLKSTKGRVILLDFWYMACYGCVLSYPTINKLHQDFVNNNSVEIYSVNPFDLEDKQREKLKNYVKKYQMESNLVKMEEKQFDYFRTNAYPTFYVIVDGVVKAIKIGSHDDLYKELKTLIEEGLKQLK